MFDWELADMLDLDFTKYEHSNLGGVAGAARGYIAHRDRDY